MENIKKDIFSGEVVIFAPHRTSRPTDIKLSESENISKKEYEKDCPFCKGNENMVCKTFELKNDSGWLSKSVLNKYPIINENMLGINGSHEVILDTYRHNGSFYDMTKEEFKNMFLVYKNRYKHYIEKEDTLYVSIFKNFLKKAGASLSHPHSQIISMNLIPKIIENEVDVLKKYYDLNKESLYKKYIDEEISLDKRVVYNGRKFLVIVPYASIYNNEIRVICKDCLKFEDLNEEYLEELSYIFERLFRNIYKVCGYEPFNLGMHNHPKNLCNDLFNFHFHIIPRKYNLGGFEISNGVYVSSSNPDDFAKSIKFI